MEKLIQVTNTILNDHYNFHNDLSGDFFVANIYSTVKLMALYYIWVTLFSGVIKYTPKGLYIDNKKCDDLKINEDEFLVKISKLVKLAYKNKSEVNLWVFCICLWILNNMDYRISKKYYFTQKCKLFKKGVLCL